MGFLTLSTDNLSEKITCKPKLTKDTPVFKPHLVNGKLVSDATPDLLENYMARLGTAATALRTFDANSLFLSPNQLVFPYNTFDLAERDTLDNLGRAFLAAKAIETKYGVPAALTPGQLSEHEFTLILEMKKFLNI